MKMKSISYGVLAGSALGAIAALLTTPQSGKDLKGQIRKNKDEWKSILLEIKTNAVEVKDAVSRLSSEGKETITHLKDDMQNSIQAWQGSTEPNIQHIKDEISAIEQLAEDMEQTVSKQ
ncbi:YtxH domain-containing protein [Bacillus salacetis]|uniref:YtxH domain-containing protein n=1 Tax=Bacillus salacetis TaxID=2315464 RepID=A0A3A1R780_9BACI|nr:YtxH domain-containing protein [Bacillus salacetis]RIW35361.1 YtxH domain-containing protein [Bacillus salacetis]